MAAYYPKLLIAVLYHGTPKMELCSHVMYIFARTLFKYFIAMQYIDKRNKGKYKPLCDANLC